VGQPPYEGTDCYCPPEPREGYPRDDWYALSKILLEGIYGVEPKLLQPHLVALYAEKYQKPFDIAIWDIAKKGCNLNPAERFQKTNDFLDALSKARELLR
jgi:serine/threonine protein kinase